MKTHAHTQMNRVCFTVLFRTFALKGEKPWACLNGSDMEYGDIKSGETYHVKLENNLQ